MSSSLTASLSLRPLGCCVYLKCTWIMAHNTWETVSAQNIFAETKSPLRFLPVSLLTSLTTPLLTFYWLLLLHNRNSSVRTLCWGFLKSWRQRDFCQCVWLVSKIPASCSEARIAGKSYCPYLSGSAEKWWRKWAQESYVFVRVPVLSLLSCTLWASYLTLCASVFSSARRWQ